MTRQDARALLAYRTDAAGGLMSPRFARLRPEASIDEAITYLRQQVGQVETIYSAYVLDDEQRLLGVLSLRDLVVADPAKTVRDVMTTDVHKVGEDTDQEVVARLLSDHGLQAVPVVDRDGRMKGIITVDDLVDVIREMDSADMQKIGGMEALDGPYLETSFLGMMRKRAGWLVVLFLGEMLTATAMSYYEHQIEAAVVLALFVPLIISSGGNSGSQATTLIIRAMALGEIRLHRLVARDRPRTGGRIGARMPSRLDRIYPHRRLASHRRQLRRILSAGRRNHCVRPRGRRELWLNRRIDAALHPAPLRPRPGQRVRPLRRNPRRRHRPHHLFQRRQADPDRDGVVATLGRARYGRRC